MKWIRFSNNQIAFLRCVLKAFLALAVFLGFVLFLLITLGGGTRPKLDKLTVEVFVFCAIFYALFFFAERLADSEKSDFSADYKDVASGFASSLLYSFSSLMIIYIIAFLVDGAALIFKLNEFAFDLLDKNTFISLSVSMFLGGMTYANITEKKINNK